MFDMIVFIRLLGLIALFWTNWIAGLIGFILLGITGKAKDSIRLLIEFITHIMAIAGIWYFPLIEPSLAHIFAVVAIIITVLHYAFLFQKNY